MQDVQAEQRAETRRHRQRTDPNHTRRTTRLAAVTARHARPAGARHRPVALQPGARELVEKLGALLAQRHAALPRLLRRVASGRQSEQSPSSLSLRLREVPSIDLPAAASGLYKRGDADVGQPRDFSERIALDVVQHEDDAASGESSASARLRAPSASLVSAIRSGLRAARQSDRLEHARETPSSIARARGIECAPRDDAEQPGLHARSPVEAIRTIERPRNACWTTSSTSGSVGPRMRPA